MAERGELKFIIVDVRDRLGRGDAISVLEFLTRQAGTEIVYATQPADLDTYEGAALDATETLVSRIERLNIRRRTNRGRREWTSEGRIFTGRFYPYGYRIKIVRDDKGRLVERTLVIYEPEAEIVEQIYRWFVLEDRTTHSIAVSLEKLGVPVPEAHRSNRKRTVSQWYASTIERILKNETYAGVWYYGKRLVQKYEAGTRVRYRTSAPPAEHHIAVEVPAIVSRDLWEAAQENLKRHSHGGNTPIHNYLLRGRLRCVKSNANLTGQTVKDRRGEYYGYYTCPHRSISHRFDPAIRCTVRQIPQRKVEHWMWATLMKLAKHPERIEEELQVRLQEKEAALQLVRQALVGVEQEIARVNRQKNELLDLYLNRDKEAIGLRREDYEVKGRRLNQQLDELEARRAELQSQMQTEAISPTQLGEVRRLLGVVRRAGPKATFAEKRELLRLLDIRVLYNGEKLEMTGSIPTRELTLEELKCIVPPDLWEPERTIPPGDTSSHPPQSEPSGDSRAAGRGTTSDRCRRSTGYN
jgi:site-specific DNA recombinase